MITRIFILSTQSHTPTTSDRFKGTNITRRIISVDTYAYGFNSILHDKPRPFHRLRWPVPLKGAGFTRSRTYAITVLRILTRFRWNQTALPVINDRL